MTMSSGASVKILLVDDDDSSRRAAGVMLSFLGYDVLQVSDAASAWREFLRYGPRIIISDWVMPDYDGIELCRRIRKAPRTEYTYFMILTGKRTGKQNLISAMDAGVDDFLTKPPDRDILRVRLRMAERILGLTERVRELDRVLPICSYCRQVRRVDGLYESLESYLSGRRIEFSHGVCPKCQTSGSPA